MRRAWEPLLEQLAHERYAGLLAFASLLVGPGGDPEGLVREALLATVGGRARLTSVEVVERGVRRAIVSRFVDRLRRDEREGDAGERVPRLSEPGQAPDVATELEAALAQLAPSERACVVLRQVEGLSVAESARQLRLGVGGATRCTDEGVRALNAALGTDVSDGVEVRLVAGHGGRRVESRGP